MMISVSEKLIDKSVDTGPALAHRRPCSNFLPSPFSPSLPVSSLPLKTSCKLPSGVRPQSHFAALYACKTQSWSQH